MLTTEEFLDLRPNDLLVSTQAISFHSDTFTMAMPFGFLPETEFGSAGIL